MKLKELTEGIAGTCNVRPQVVSAVHAETFRLVRAALDKGERVTIPGFGIFVSKEVAGENGEPAKKVLRFRARNDDVKADEKKKARREKKKAEKSAKEGGGA